MNIKREFDIAKLPLKIIAKLY